MFLLNHSEKRNSQKEVKNPIINLACRSRSPTHLKLYQTKLNTLKPGEAVYRPYISDDKVEWNVDYPEYEPIEYTTPRILKDRPVWADTPDVETITSWNQIDEKTDRRSHEGEYKVINGRPINPKGRTGITGRGQLGKWGPNHAADPIVTRWKRDEFGNKVKGPHSDKYILQFVLIKRSDNGEWALPGGMNDPNEKISQTLKREFMEEAIDVLGTNESRREEITQYLREFFDKGEEIYKGYVDDPRNTDNAWMETVAFNFHDDDGSVFENFELKGGDDASSVRWADFNGFLGVYANHLDFIKKTVEKRQAYLKINFGNIIIGLGTCKRKNKMHVKCRSTNEHNLVTYINDPTLIKRPYVPESHSKWSTNWPEYRPVEFTIREILENVEWADDNDSTKYKYNQLDGKIDRRSHLGKYEIVDGRPRNPIGRTGISGRGQLGKWGVNHAADPIVTRWKKDEKGNKIKNPISKKFILQFVAIKRKDTNEWAIPGGMCDPGEKVSQTLKREFMEEAANSHSLSESQKNELDALLKEFFENGIEIYKGYVDDPRNTDNAWMETIVYNFHDENDTVVTNIKLEAGDDAGSVKWMDIDNMINLYASHKEFIDTTAKRHHAHWSEI